MGYLPPTIFEHGGLGRPLSKRTRMATFVCADVGSFPRHWFWHRPTSLLRCNSCQCVCVCVCVRVVATQVRRSSDPSESLVRTHTSMLSERGDEEEEEDRQWIHGDENERDLLAQTQTRALGLAFRSTADRFPSHPNRPTGVAIFVSLYARRPSSSDFRVDESAV